MYWCMEFSSNGENRYYVICSGNEPIEKKTSLELKLDNFRGQLPLYKFLVASLIMPEI